MGADGWIHGYASCTVNGGLRVRIRNALKEHVARQMGPGITLDYDNEKHAWISSRHDDQSIVFHYAEYMQIVGAIISEIKAFCRQNAQPSNYCDSFMPEYRVCARYATSGKIYWYYWDTEMVLPGYRAPRVLGGKPYYDRSWRYYPFYDEISTRPRYDGCIRSAGSALMNQFFPTFESFFEFVHQFTPDYENQVWT